MGDYRRAVQAALRELSPGQVLASLLSFVTLSLTAGWTCQQVWFPAASVDLSAVPWELLCVAEEVTGRKCVVAMGGLVHQGRYVVAVGGSVMGIVSIGQVAVGIVSVGWLACGVLLAAGISAVASWGLVWALVAFGGHSPACMLGLTLLKTPLSQGVLNYAALHLPGAIPTGRRKAKESPRVEDDEEGGKEESTALRRHHVAPAPQRQQQEQEEEEWPYTHKYSRYASGA